MTVHMVIGTLFLAGCLVVLSRQMGGALPRSMRVAVIADGASLRSTLRVFSEHRITAEALEISHGEQTIIRYKAVLNGDRQLELVSQQLLEDGGNGIGSVSWEAPKRGKLEVRSQKPEVRTERLETGAR